ncbi:SRPBCC family protein [Mycolicibacterium sp. S2-37]|uniref:SRPBCC family protein n=1 Tax=Mycolicibacterium sp. S2-37 TaxID=2810297 RepID=UPI001A942133|nr:SRPBCC family protein [Mycolicibacterium sp. S2-37]MBO0678541.1 SRPBCC family protein [Mycolicibacterium sp. S2-37]
MGVEVSGGSVIVSRIVPAAPAAVWSVLTDLKAWPKWGPTVAGAELDDGGELALGARGKVFTPIGLPLPFTISEFDPGRRWAWRVAGVPATAHGVDPVDAGTRVYMSAPLPAAPYVPVLVIALRRIDRMTS